MRIPNHVVVAALTIAIVLITARGANAQACANGNDQECRNFVVKTTIIIVGAVAGIVILKNWLGGRAERRAEERRNAAPGDLNVRYEPTTGQALVNVLFKPVANCPETWSASSATVVRGELPPGLRITNDLTITGQPDIPGDWEPTVRFSGLTCKDRTYPDKDVRVPITIKQ